MRRAVDRRATGTAAGLDATASGPAPAGERRVLDETWRRNIVAMLCADGEGYTIRLERFDRDTEQWRDLATLGLEDLASVAMALTDLIRAVPAALGAELTEPGRRP